MIKHVVTFIWNDDVTDAQVADVTEVLTRLPSLIDSLDDYTFGRDLDLTDGTGDFAIIATVADIAALRAYLEHPDHVPVANRLRSMAQSRIAVQIEG